MVPETGNLALGLVAQPVFLENLFTFLGYTALETNSCSGGTRMRYNDLRI